MTNSFITNSDRRVHPAALAFPLLFGEGYEALKADISAHGQRVPCVLWHDGSLLDGRNRWRACEELKIVPKTVTWDGDDPVAYIVSTNLARRHLTPSQAAACAVEMLPLLEAEAAARRTAPLKRGALAPVCQFVDERGAGRATAKAAAHFGTNRQYVAEAKALKAEAPEVFEKVRGGELTIPEALRIVRPARRGTLSVPEALGLLARAGELLEGARDGDGANGELVEAATLLHAARDVDLEAIGVTLEQLQKVRCAAERAGTLAREITLRSERHMGECLAWFETRGLLKPGEGVPTGWLEELISIAGERMVELAP